MDKPYRTILHDIMSDEEIKHIINISKPNLSRTRYHTKRLVPNIKPDPKHGPEHGPRT